jgi:GNAT superfamily N-acetyltransferase
LDSLETDITEERILAMKGAMKKGDSVFVVALVQKQMVGMLRYSKSSSDKTLREAEIRAFYILEEYQKMGLGTKMLRFAAKEMLDVGYKDLVICCIDKNPANQFYRKAGGVQTCTRSFHLAGKTYQDNMYYFSDLKKLLN